MTRAWLSTARGRGSKMPGRRCPWGATAPSTAEKPRASASRQRAASSRVSPIPASPASRRNWPRPAVTSSRRRSVRTSRSSRPTRSGRRTALTRYSSPAKCQPGASEVIGHSTDDPKPGSSSARGAGLGGAYGRTLTDGYAASSVDRLCEAGQIPAAGPASPGSATDYGTGIVTGAAGLTETHPERSGPYRLPIDVPVIGTATGAVAVMCTTPLWT